MMSLNMFYIIFCMSNVDVEFKANTSCTYKLQCKTVQCNQSGQCSVRQVKLVHFMPHLSYNVHQCLKDVSLALKQSGTSPWQLLWRFYKNKKNTTTNFKDHECLIVHSIPADAARRETTGETHFEMWQQHSDWHPLGGDKHRQVLRVEWVEAPMESHAAGQ